MNLSNHSKTQTHSIWSGRIRVPTEDKTQNLTKGSVLSVSTAAKHTRTQYNTLTHRAVSKTRREATFSCVLWQSWDPFGCCRGCSRVLVCRCRLSIAIWWSTQSTASWGCCKCSRDETRRRFDNRTMTTPTRKRKKRNSRRFRHAENLFLFSFAPMGKFRSMSPWKQFY